VGYRGVMDDDFRPSEGPNLMGNLVIAMVF
jgi:hypothetical protein